MSEYFSLSECDVIGFDLDHTLCRYHLKETSRLIYESFARYLVEHKGYDKDLLNLTPATWDFCFKGLVVDLEDGNLVKLAEDGTVLRATHGSNDLSTEEIIKHYGPKREWKHFNSLNTSFTRSAKYYFYDNYFDLPGALLCGRVVDMLHKRGNEVNPDFWKDMVAAIDHNYNTSAFKGWCFCSKPAHFSSFVYLCINNAISPNIPLKHTDDTLTPFLFSNYKFYSVFWSVSGTQLNTSKGTLLFKKVSLIFLFCVVLLFTVLVRMC